LFQAATYAMKQRPTNMIPRTKTIKTPLEGKEIKLKAFLTGGEKISLADSEDKSNIEITRRMIKVVVLAVDDNKEKRVEAIESLHGKDFDFVLQEITKVVDESSLTEKKMK